MKRPTKKGFLRKELNTSETKKTIKSPTGRLISWSPWPPASFKNRYPAFPLVTTILILTLLRWITTTK